MAGESTQAKGGDRKRTKLALISGLIGRLLLRDNIELRVDEKFIVENRPEFVKSKESFG